MKKQFLAIWTGEYDDRYSTVDEGFFTEEQGYRPEDIERIQAVTAGIPISIDFGNHYVIRLKDVKE